MAIKYHESNKNVICSEETRAGSVVGDIWCGVAKLDERPQKAFLRDNIKAEGK